MACSVYHSSKYPPPPAMFRFFPRDRSGQKWSTAAISEPKLHSLRYSVSIVSESVYMADKMFSCLQTHFHTRNLSKLSIHYHYFLVKYSNKLRSFIPPTLTLPAKTLHAAYIEANYSHSLHIHLVRS